VICDLHRLHWKHSNKWYWLTLIVCQIQGSYICTGMENRLSAIGNMGLFITALVHVSTDLIHFGKLHHWKTVCTSICSFFLLQYRDKSWHIPDLHFPVVADWWDFLGKFSVGSLLLSQVRLMFLHPPFCKKCLSQIITFLTAKKLFEAAIVFEYNL